MKLECVFLGLNHYDGKFGNVKIYELGIWGGYSGCMPTWAGDDDGGTLPRVSRPYICRTQRVCFACYVRCLQAMIFSRKKTRKSRKFRRVIPTTQFYLKRHGANSARWRPRVVVHEGDRAQRHFYL